MTTDPDPEPDTYYSRAQSALADEAGRFAKPRPTMSPASVGPVPEWSRDLAKMPPEPPLNVDINATPDLGFVKAAAVELGGPRVAPATAIPTVAVETDAGPPKPTTSATPKALGTNAKPIVRRRI